MKLTTSMAASGHPGHRTGSEASECTQSATGRANTEPARHIPIAKTAEPVQARVLGDGSGPMPAKPKTSNASASRAGLRGSSGKPRFVESAAGMGELSTAFPVAEEEELIRPGCLAEKGKPDSAGFGGDSVKSSQAKAREGAERSK